MKETSGLANYAKENRRSYSSRCPFGKHRFIKGECACGQKKKEQRKSLKMMKVKLTKEQWQARAECYQEAADHLLADWTTDEVEIEQAKLVYRFLYAKSVECQGKADDK